MPRVIGWHFIFSAYGFWLPNDPRGSWSDTIRVLDLLKFGPPTKVETSASLAHTPHDRAKRLAAKQALRHPPVHFTGEQARALVRGFRAAIDDAGYLVNALAVLPDHVHLLMAPADRTLDLVSAHFKSKATGQLLREHLHPLFGRGAGGRSPSPWARNYWCPFIRDERHLQTAKRYVEQNPVKAGLPAQRWKFLERNE